METLILTTNIEHASTKHNHPMTHCKSKKGVKTEAKVNRKIEGLSNHLFLTPFAAAEAFQLGCSTLHRWLAS